MSLVAYDSSEDESGNEEETSSTVSQVVKKTRDPVKITIPSLTEFKEDKAEEPVKKPKSQGGCGLFSILPPPKNASTFSKPGFTPYVFSKKKEAKPASSEGKASKAKIVITEKKTPEEADLYVEPDSSNADDPDDSPEKVDFFSLESNASYSEPVNDATLEGSVTEISPLPDTPSISENHQPSESAIEYYTGTDASDVSTSSFEASENVSTSNFEQSFIEATTEKDIFNDKEFLRLAGKRKKEDINFIEVNADDQLTGKDEWILQSLTEEKVHRPSKRRHDMPTQQQKRKHQITYLAFQAKERELDLKNQWALNSRTRRETQAKYGF